MLRCSKIKVQQSAGRAIAARFMLAEWHRLWISQPALGFHGGSGGAADAESAAGAEWAAQRRQFSLSTPQPPRVCAV